MKIVVIGGTGLIGSKTVAILRQGGREVVAPRNCHAGSSVASSTGFPGSDAHAIFFE